VEEQAEYCSLRLELTDGDFLLLFTDGLTEARKPGARREFLDAAGFQEFVHQEYQRHNPQAGGTSAKEIGHALLERVQSYSGGTLQDDACLLLMRLTSATLKDKGQGDGS
jgi:serine phosphatase RsbU (regulator of sigma subunit)